MTFNVNRNRYRTGFAGNWLVCLLLAVCFVMLSAGTKQVYAAVHVPRLSEKRFEAELLDMVDEYDGYVLKSRAARDPYLSRRLILKSADRTIDPAVYGAVEAIQDREGHYILQFESADAAMQAQEKLEQLSSTIYVEPDRYVFLASADNVHDRLEDEEVVNWGVNAIGADIFAWYLKKTGAEGSVKVAVLDSGIRKTHEIFEERLSPNGEYDYYSKDDDASDEYGHGTMVAGIVAQCTKGLDNIRIIPVRVLGSTGGTSFSICAAAVLGVSNYADVLNLSFAMSSTTISELSEGQLEESRYMEECIHNVTEAGTVVVISAGNSHGDSAQYVPANITDDIAAGCIVVGNSTKQKTPSTSSNYGEAVDVSAPGTGIVSSYIGSDRKYAMNSGTSFSAPHVAAAAAMLKLYDPSLSPAEIEMELESHVNPLNGTLGRNYGSGIIDLTQFIPQEYLDAYDQYIADIEAVIAKINALPETIALDDKADVEDARSAYDALTDDQKSRVTNLSVLEAAEECIIKLEADKEAADAVIAKISGLPETITLDDKAIVKEARSAYDALTDDQKSLVTNLTVLTDAEDQISRLEADQAAAESVMELISDLPSPITLADKEAVEYARASYDALTDDQKSLVTNLSVLEAAEAKVQELINAAEDKEEEQTDSQKKYPRSDPKPNVTYRVPLKKKQKTRVLRVIGLADGDKVVSWKSSNKKKAKVTGKPDGTCQIKAGKKTGKVRITAVTASGRKVIFKLRIQSSKVKTEKIRIAKRTVRISAGETYALMPERYPITSVQKITYKSRDKSVAKVSKKGVIRGIAAGTTKVVISSGDRKIKVKVIVS